MRVYLALLAIACVAVSACDNKPKPKQEQVVMVSLPPPPPPPKPRPTPPPVEQPVEQKVQEKQTIDPDPKPQMAKPEPPKPDEPPAGLGSNIKGSGDDGFGLSGSGNDGIVGGFGSGKKGGGNADGYYAGQVQGWIGDALRQDSRTRAARLSTKVKLWIDDSGKITRVEPGSGDNVESLEKVLIGMRLPARPPAGKTMIVTYNIAARRP